MAIEQKIYAVFVISACLLWTACSNDETRLASDAEKTAQLRQLGSRLDSGFRLSVEEFDALRSIYEEFPGSSSARTVYEKALIQRKDWGTLAAFYEAGRKFDPESERNLAKTYIKLGKYERALEVASAFDFDSDPELRRVATAAYFQTGRYGDAKRILDDHWTSIVENKEVSEMSIRGMIHFYDGEDDKAIEILNRVQEIDPGNITANNGLSRVYASRGQTEKAKEALARVRDSFAKITAEEAAKTAYVEKIYQLQEHYKNKRFKEAINIAQQLVPDASDQQRFIIYQYMYNSHKALGNEAEARAVLDKARRLKQK